jgi:glycosyltransferase involved in cell wall biosynthesis
MEFSVLMSVYFKEKPEFLKEAIRSTLEQTLPPNEIVIILDGKLTDALYETLDNFKKEKPGLFKFVQLEVNKGLGKALEIGINECKYNVIARMDTDDICHPERFEKQINFLIQNPDIDVVGSWIGEFDENPNEISTIRRVPLTSKEIIRYAKRRNPINHMTVMYRKNAVLGVGNYQPFLWNEDYYLWVRMLKARKKFANIPEILVYARTGNEMFKRRGGLKYLKQDIHLQKEFLKMDFVTKKEYYGNVLVRGFVRILPNNFRGKLYKTLLRR